MKRIPKQLKKNGFDYIEQFRKDNVAIYSQFSGKKTIAFEVFEVKSHEGYEIGGAKVDPAEMFPSNESFGKTAWTVPTIDKALIKMNELIQKIKARSMIESVDRNQLK